MRLARLLSQLHTPLPARSSFSQRGHPVLVHAAEVALSLPPSYPGLCCTEGSSGPEENCP